MDKTREDFIKYCLQSDRATLAEYAADRRLSATRSNAEAEEIELFLRYRPDLKAEEPTAPEKAKRGKKKAASTGDELEDTKRLVTHCLYEATPEMATKIHIGLDLNHGLTTATIDRWTLTDAQNAMAVIRGLEMNLSQILDTSSPPF